MNLIYPRRALILIGVGCFLFLYAPIIAVVLNAFNKSRLGFAWEGFTLEWFIKLSENQMIIDALKNSIQVAVCASLLSAVLGTAAAVGLVRGSLAYARLFSSLIKLPLILPDLVLGISSLVIFSVISFSLGIESIIISHTTFCVSFVSLVVSSRLVSLNKTLDLAAKDLGATDTQIFFKITLPQLYPSILAGALLSFTLSLDDYVISSFTAGVGGTTLPIRVYSMIKFGVTPEINALSVILLLVSLSTAFVITKVDSKSILRM